MKLASFSAKSTTCQIKQQAMSREYTATPEFQMTPKDNDDNKCDEDYDKLSRNNQSTTTNWKTTPFSLDDDFEDGELGDGDVLELGSYSAKACHIVKGMGEKHTLLGEGGAKGAHNIPTCQESILQDVFSRPTPAFRNGVEFLQSCDRSDEDSDVRLPPAQWTTLSPTPLPPLEDRLDTGASLLCVSTAASQDFSTSALENSTYQATTITATDEKASAKEMPHWEKIGETATVKQSDVNQEEAQATHVPVQTAGRDSICSRERFPLLPDICGVVMQDREPDTLRLNDPSARVDDDRIPSSFELQKMLISELAQREVAADLTIPADFIPGEWIEVRIVDSMIDYELDADDVEQVFSSLTNVKKVTIEAKDKSIALVEVEEGQGADIVALLDGHQLQDMNGKLSLRLLQETLGGKVARNSIGGSECQSTDALSPATVSTSRNTEKLESVDLLRFLSETAAEVGATSFTGEGNVQRGKVYANSSTLRSGEGDPLGGVFGFDNESTLFGEVLNEKFNGGERSYADLFEELWLETRKGSATAEGREKIDRKNCNYDHGFRTGIASLQQRHSVAAGCGVSRNVREVEPLGFPLRYSNSNLLDDLENLQPHLRASKSAITPDITDLLLHSDRPAFSNNDRLEFDLHRGSSPIDFSWNGGGLMSSDPTRNTSRVTGDFSSPSARQKQQSFAKTTVAPGNRSVDQHRGSSGQGHVVNDSSPFGIHFESPAQVGNKFRTNLSDVSTSNRTDQQASFASPLDAYSAAMAAAYEGDSSTFTPAQTYCFDSPDGRMHIFSHPTQDCDGCARTPFQLEPSETGSHENYNTNPISSDTGGTYSFHPHASPANANQSRVRKWTARYDIQIPTDNNFQVTRRIIGTRGANMKRINQVTGAKLRLRGRGSGYLEGSSRLEADDPLHLCISCCDNSKYKAAKQMVDKLLKQIYQDYDIWSKDICAPQPHLVVKVREVFLPNRDGGDVVPSQQTPVASSDVKFTCLNY